jgi:hypothetical protein
MGGRQVSQLNLSAPKDFADAFRAAAEADKVCPIHRLIALSRVAERLDLADDVRAESILLRDEGALRQSLGGRAGGQAGKGRSKSCKPPKT